MVEQDQTFRLLAVDTAGIQSYIFNSNRLRENIGASYLIKLATEEWVLETLNLTAKPHNWHDVNAAQPFNDQQIENGALNAEVIYAGGGNVVILFKTKDYAVEFTHALSRQALCEAPGLQLDIYAEDFIWSTHKRGLNEAIKTLLSNMKKARGVRPTSAPLGGLGVTVMCQSTALPAVTTRHEQGKDFDILRYVSAEVAAKWDAADETVKWLNAALLKNKSYSFPLDLDQLGRTKGEQSYIAVVHIDGNGMGELIRQIGINNPANRDYINQMRAFSQDVKHIATEAMRAALDLIITKSVENKCIPGVGNIADLEFDWDTNARQLILPIRPLVFGGDDTTFVCDGRIGLSLAVAYLNAFETEARKANRKLTACAGVAIVKSHYPFARAYDLAEELCGEAKEYRHKQAISGSALDWYFTTGGLYDELENMRKREYYVSEGNLSLRPISLHKHESGGSGRNWEDINSVTREFQTKWSGMRNKAKMLRDALRAGPEAVKQFRLVYEQTSDLPPLPGFNETGWHDKRCGYFDALELADIHIVLEQTS